MKQLKPLKREHKEILKKKGYDWHEFGLKNEDNAAFIVVKKKDFKTGKEYIFSK